MPRRRIYLDNAATSWPKPEAVYAVVERYQRTLGAPAGRGAYAEAGEVEKAVEATRAGLARLLGAADPRQVIFTFNGTDSLNLAIHGLLGEGDHVVTTVVEHNSVLRPVATLEGAGRISVTRVGCDAAGVVDPGDIRAAINSRTRLIALVHASNVTGAVQPVEVVGEIAREHGVTFLMDAAQTVGELPIDVSQLPVDLLAAPGHKGLLGPLGTGLLYIRPGLEQRLASVRQGGTGSRSESDRQPETLPDKYEAGNLNVPGILGLGAGVEFLAGRGIEAVRAGARALAEQLLDGLSAIEGVTIHGPPTAEGRVAVVSISIQGYDPQEVAAMLDAAHGIQTRSGLHCAARMHAALGTLERGGTVRLSPGVFNTAEDIEAAVQAVQQLASAAVEMP